MAKSIKKPSRTVRASQRSQPVPIDAAYPPLKRLMIEQCRSDDGYVTVYRATREELLEAGVPEGAFPVAGEQRAHFEIQTKNVCCTGSSEKVTGTMMKADSGFELEIHWGDVRPYIQAAHPALNELARMMLRDVMRWTDDYKTNSLEQPFEQLALDTRATDFKPSAGARKFKVTPEFHKVLREAASKVFELVHTHGEILLAKEADSPPEFGGNVIVLRQRTLH